MKKLDNKTSRPKFKPFKPIETAIILVVILIGVSGILYQKHEQKVHEQLNIAPTSGQSSQETQSSPAANTSTPAQPAQSTTQNTTSTPRTNNLSGSGSNSSTDNALNSALQQTAFQLNCDDQASTAGNAYSNALPQAYSAYTSTYNSDVDNWEAEEDTTNAPPVSVQNSFRDAANSAYNAIADPAWTALNNLISSLTSQGCTDMTSPGPEPNGIS